MSEFNPTEPTVNLGYACINLTLHEVGITTNRGMIKRTFQEKGIQYASQLALQNVRDLLQVVDWNLENGVRLFRISSEVFPWWSEYRFESLPDFFEIRSLLEEIGKKPIRLTVHPGPFNKMAGEGATLTNTIIDLEQHSGLFDLMGLTPSHWNKINIHVGGAYGDKNETLRRFARNFPLLSENLRKRLTVENDDKSGLYTIAELFPLHEMTGIPLVFDYFHHSLYPGFQTEREAFEMAFSTWDLRPVFHYSDSRRENEDPSARKEAHSDWVYGRVRTYGREVDIMLETKMKELSLRRYLSPASYNTVIER
ncbi:UV DNA damage repair endonuclease UvsE [Larkinella soli]|uniref:UV DNA damage repair endonuclease UvsE n=1 Tax=Larkinella soli TaxID=1770527 RepID=UPI000FFC94BF|nr:UV DNA damage repair endonuclease UvsE [Larkinella soli]